MFGKRDAATAKNLRDKDDDANVVEMPRAEPIVPPTPVATVVGTDVEPVAPVEPEARPEPVVREVEQAAARATPH